MSTVRIVTRSSRRGLPWAIAAIGVATIALLVPWSAPVEVNVSPLARATVSGQVGRALPGADLQECLPEVMLDGTLDTLYLARVPAASNAPEVTLRWPAPVDLRRIAVLGGDPNFSGAMLVLVGPERLVLQRDPTDEGSPVFAERAIRVRVDTLVIRWLGHPEGASATTLNAVAAMAVVPRWQAWLYVLGLNVVGPWLVGAIVTAGVLGLGRLLGAQADLGRQMILGLCGSTALAAAWIFAPRAVWVSAVFLTVLAVAATWELVVGGIRAGVADRRLFALVAAAAFLLVLDVFIDTYVVMSRRMQPVDYLHSYVGSQLLAARLPMVGPLLLRPWLLHAFFAPLTSTLGRFSYWGYVGIMAWLNALVLIPVVQLARSWGHGDGLAVAGWMALLPILGGFNACGQRPLAAACCLLAIDAWQQRRGLWGSAALTTAIGIHPGSLFLIPPAAVVILWRRGLAEMLRSLCLPVAAYLAWSAGVRAIYPEAAHNVIVFYPLMTSYETTFPPGSTLLSAARGLSVQHWSLLFWNRVSQLGQYLWSPNWSEPAVDTFRWVSLVSTLGVVWTISLLRPSVWRGRGEFVVLAVVGPLVVHHLDIGLANAMFHVSPTPFFALSLLALSAGTMPAWAVRLALVELFARRWFPLAIVIGFPEKRGEPDLSRFGLLDNDRISCMALAALAPLAWLLLAGWVRDLELGGPGSIQDQGILTADAVPPSDLP